MQDSKCERCGFKLKLWKKTDSIRCDECGAQYELVSAENQDVQMNYEFEFVGFKCMFSALQGTCNNDCPAPEMYCKEHLTDDSFKYAKLNITHAEKRLEEVKGVLERMEESKKTYLIKEISGV